MYGKGVYSTPDPDIADGFASNFTSDGVDYKVLIQNCVNMDDTVIIENDPDLPNGWVYFVTANEDNIHPYGLIFSKI